MGASEELFWDHLTVSFVENAVLGKDPKTVADSLQARVGELLSQSLNISDMVSAIAERTGEILINTHGDTLDLEGLIEFGSSLQASLTTALEMRSTLGFAPSITGKLAQLFSTITPPALNGKPIVEEVKKVIPGVPDTMVDLTPKISPKAGPIHHESRGKPGRRRKTDITEEEEEQIESDAEARELARREGYESAYNQYMRGTLKYPLLTLEQERELAMKIHAGQDAQKTKEALKSADVLVDDEKRELNAIIAAGDKAYDTMVCSNLRLVVKIAFKYRNLGLDIEDLISEGNRGLMKTAERFDPSKGGKFSTYGAWWIKQSIKRALADQSRDIRLPVHMVDKILKMRRVALGLEGLLGREPTDREVAEELGIEEDTVYQWRTIAVRPASLDAEVGDDGVTTLGDFIRDAGAEDASEKLMVKNDLSQIDDELLAVLSDRELAIIRARFGLGGGQPRTLEDVGSEFDITRERVRQLQKIALDKLRDALEKRDSSEERIKIKIKGAVKKEKKRTPVHGEDTVSTSSSTTGQVILDETWRSMIRAGYLGLHGSPLMTIADLARDLDFLEEDVTATLSDMGVSLNSGDGTDTSGSDNGGSITTSTQKQKKRLSLPAQGPLIPQTREQLLANSHLNDRHPVQREILEKILHDMVEEHILTGYIHEPARVGKTAIYVDFLRHFFHYLRDALSLKSRVFLVVPSTVLMDQVPGEIQKFFPQISVGAYYGKEKNLDSDVVVITYHSFNNLVEKGTIRPEETGCVILDEAHNALSDWRRDIIDRFSESIRLGGTATSELGDERTVESLLRHQYHRMSIVQAVEYGLIAPYKVIYIQTDTDLSEVKIVQGDYAEGDLARKIDSKDRNALSVELYKQTFMGRKAIAYCGTIGHSHSLRDDFLAADISSISIDSSPEYHDRDLEGFKRGEYMIATNPLKLTEGYDDDQVEVIFCIRPSFSPRVVGQSRPRGQTLRNDKVCSYIVEFLDPTVGDFPLSYEEFVLRDHQKTTGDRDFSLEQLRKIMHDRISARGTMIEMPREIGGHLVASDPASIKMVFDIREADRRNKLLRAGITPGDPPDDWPSCTELETFARMKKGWLASHVFRILQAAGFKYSELVKKHKSRYAAREYISPKAIPAIYKAYDAKFGAWERPSESFSREKLTNVVISTLDSPHTNGGVETYSMTFTSLVENIGCDLSSLEVYGAEYFHDHGILFSLQTQSCQNIEDLDGLKVFMHEKEIQEISLEDILGSIEMDKITLISRIAGALQKNQIPLERLKKEYIHIDHWLMIADEIKI